MSTDTMGTSTDSEGWVEFAYTSVINQELPPRPLVASNDPLMGSRYLQKDDIHDVFKPVPVFPGSLHGFTTPLVYNSCAIG